MKVYLFVMRQNTTIVQHWAGHCSDLGTRGREGKGRARPLSSVIHVQGRTFQKTLPLPHEAEIKIT